MRVILEFLKQNKYVLCSEPGLGPGPGPATATPGLKCDENNLSATEWTGVTRRMERWLGGSVLTCSGRSSSQLGRRLAIVGRAGAHF